MIDAKQAVAAARKHASELFATEFVTLEAIEREEYLGRDAWSITLGLVQPTPPNATPLSPLAGMMLGSARTNLSYKRILIDAGTGEFLAMQMREVAA